MTILGNHAVRNCSFRGASDVSSNSDGTVTIKLQTIGDNRPKSLRENKREKEMVEVAEKSNLRPEWYCKKPKFPYTLGHTNTICDSVLRCDW